MSTAPSAYSAFPLESVVITQELGRRSTRQPDNQAVNAALVRLSQILANSPRSILQQLVETALDLCQAHSAGISLLEEEDGQKIFRWHSVAGEYAPHLWGTTPRSFSPCGTVLDTDTVQLMSYLDRHFTYFAKVQPRIVEALLVPFHVDGEAVGTIWVISHNQVRQFDAADARVMNSLAEFAAAAYQVVSSLSALKETRAAVERINGDLLRSNEELGLQINDRKRAEDALRIVNADLELFALAASHDLQEPLRTVTVFTQLLEQKLHGTLDPETEMLLSTIEGGASRMKRLIDDLLEYSRLGQEGAPSLTPIDLQDALTSALENLSAVVNQNDATITQETLPTVYADRAQLTLLFQNLIANAIKYRRSEEAPRIHVYAERENGHWVISIRDNGEGFSQRDAEDIFRAFKRLHGVDIPGTGMGLALCQKIVQRHGGVIRATSIPEEGSIFSFTLPITEPS